MIITCVSPYGQDIIIQMDVLGSTSLMVYGALLVHNVSQESVCPEKYLTFANVMNGKENHLMLMEFFLAPSFVYFCYF